MNVIIIHKNARGEFEAFEPHGCKNGAAAGLFTAKTMDEAQKEVAQRYRRHQLLYWYRSEEAAFIEYS